MRRSIRLVAPAAAAAAALLLSGCGGDKEGSPFGSGAFDPEDVPEMPEVPELEESLEGTDGGELEIPGPSTGDTEGGDTGGDTGGSGGGGGSYEGMWITTAADGGEATFIISAGSVSFEESDSMEGDLCTGTLSGDALTLSCTQIGDAPFTETSATFSMSGDTLNVAWGSGASQDYTSAY